MKRTYIILLPLFLFVACYSGIMAQGRPEGFTLLPIEAGQIAISQAKITCVVFPVAIQPAGKGTRDVSAAKVKGTDNVLMVKAAKVGFTPTNLTVIGRNGRLYSLNLRYEADPVTYNYEVVDQNSGYTVLSDGPDHPVMFSGRPTDDATLAADADTISEKRAFLHVATHSERLRLVLSSLYLKDSLIWFTLKLKNSSLLDYPATFVHFSVQDEKRAKRTAIQERVLQPVYVTPDRLIVGDRSGKFVFGFMPFSVRKHKKLVIQISDPDGGRFLTLKVGYKAILKTRVAE